MHRQINFALRSYRLGRPHHDPDTPTSNPAANASTSLRLSLSVMGRFRPYPGICSYLHPYAYHLHSTYSTAFVRLHVCPCPSAVPLHLVHALVDALPCSRFSESKIVFKKLNKRRRASIYGYPCTHAPIQWLPSLTQRSILLVFVILVVKTYILKLCPLPEFPSTFHPIRQSPAFFKPLCITVQRTSANLYLAPVHTAVDRAAASSAVSVPPAKPTNLRLLVSHET